MRVIHDPPYRPTKGKFRIIAEAPVNIGFDALQMLVPKVREDAPTAAPLLALALLQDSVAETRGVSCLTVPA